MFQFFKQRKLFLSLVVILLVAAGTIHFTSKPRPKLTFVEQIFREIVAPLQTGATRLNRSVASLISKVSELSEFAKKNEELEQVVLELRQQLNEMAEYKRENEWLRQALEFKDEEHYSILVSEVIARSTTNWLSTITINRGRKHGIVQGMPVMTGNGIVGTVHQVSAGTATVLLATDPQSAVGGLVQTSGDLVLIEGDPSFSGLLFAKPLSKDVELHVGDILVTSGLSKLYPKGMPIGKVIGIVPGRYDLSFTAHVEPFVNFTKLEYVFVVLSEG